MKAYRSEIERLIPSLRQLARALVESHRADIADDLVHDTLDEALAHERSWSVAELDLRLYAGLIGANRLRLRAEVGERRTLPSGGGRGDGLQAGHAGAATGPQGHGLDGLPLGDREALLLVVLGRLDYGRAAEVLGVPVGSLISRLTRARDTLGASLWSGPAAGPGGRGSARVHHLRLVKS